LYYGRFVQGEPGFFSKWTVCAALAGESDGAAGAFTRASNFLLSPRP
jgi:hypothetical protein